MSEFLVNKKDPKEFINLKENSSGYFALKDKVQEDVRCDKNVITIFLNNINSFNGKHILSMLKKNTQKCMQTKKDSNISLTIENILYGTFEEETVEYNFIGTSSDRNYVKPDYVSKIIDDSNENLKKNLSNCNCVIYDISEDKREISKALYALSIIEQQMEINKRTYFKEDSYKKYVKFILISTTMTWGLTPMLDHSDPDSVFLEDDYKKRKPHPNFKEHWACEKEVIQKGKKFKENLQTHVVCSGITYGLEENMLSFLFIRAWNMEKRLPIFDSGRKFLPLIHVLDLSKVICALIANNYYKPYMLAVEQTPTVLKHLIKSISRYLGSGRTQIISSTEAFLYPEINQTLYDILTTSILMEPEFILQTLQIEWESNMNIVENTENIIEEFRKSRNLKPIKIFIYGPPGCGKELLAKRLSETYNISNITPKSMLEDVIEELKEFYASSLKNIYTTKSRSKPELKEITDDEQEEDKDYEDDFSFKAGLEEKRNLLGLNWDDPSQKLSDDQIIALLRLTLEGNSSQNQGYVLYLYPKTINEALNLFEGANENINKDQYNKFRNIKPDFVVNLKASNNFLINQISKLAENDFQASMGGEKEYIQKLMYFRELEMDSFLEYFKSFKDISILEFDRCEFPSENMDEIYNIITETIGLPFGFEMNEEEKLELEIIKKQQEKLKHQREVLEQQNKLQKQKEEYEKEIENQLSKMQRQKQTEERLIILGAENYRIFLSEKCLPFLAQALIAVAEMQPADPVDYVAEYLFKNNPFGMMYDPKCDRNGEKLKNNK